MAVKYPRRMREDERQTQLNLEFAGVATIKAMAEEAETLDTAILESAVNSLELPDSDPSLKYDLSIMDTETKIIYNRLDEPTRQIIREAAPFSVVVQKFISDRARDTNDPDFPKKLRSFFFREYRKHLVDRGIIGDELFSLVNTAVRSLIKQPSAKFAADAILVHLFIICDLFERPPSDAIA